MADLNKPSKWEELPPEVLQFMLYGASPRDFTPRDALNFALTNREIANKTITGDWAQDHAKSLQPALKNARDSNWRALRFSVASGRVAAQDAYNAVASLKTPVCSTPTQLSKLIVYLVEVRKVTPSTRGALLMLECELDVAFGKHLEFLGINDAFNDFVFEVVKTGNVQAMNLRALRFSVASDRIAAQDAYDAVLSLRAPPPGKELTQLADMIVYLVQKSNVTPSVQGAFQTLRWGLNVAFSKHLERLDISDYFNDLIYHAVTTGNVEAMRQILGHPSLADMTELVTFGVESPLALAIDADDWDMVLLLLSDPRFTPVRSSVTGSAWRFVLEEFPPAEVIRAFLDRPEVDVNANVLIIGSRTPLEYAIQYGFETPSEFVSAVDTDELREQARSRAQEFMVEPFAEKISVLANYPGVNLDPAIAGAEDGTLRLKINWSDILDEDLNEALHTVWIKRVAAYLRSIREARQTSSGEGGPSSSVSSSTSSSSYSGLVSPLDSNLFAEYGSVEAAIEVLAKAGDHKLRSGARVKSAVDSVVDFLGISPQGPLIRKLLAVALGSTMKADPFKRLAFVGDMVLKLIVSMQLFALTKPVPLDTGQMTEAKKTAESREACIVFMERTGLALFVESSSRDVLAEAFEAILGALYLVWGLEEVQRVWMLFVSYRLGN
jgi:23S rRNA maturation mini-RNase III